MTIENKPKRNLNILKNGNSYTNYLYENNLCDELGVLSGEYVIFINTQNGYNGYQVIVNAFTTLLSLHEIILLKTGFFAKLFCFQNKCYYYAIMKNLANIGAYNNAILEAV